MTTTEHNEEDGISLLMSSKEKNKTEVMRMIEEPDFQCAFGRLVESGTKMPEGKITQLIMSLTLAMHERIIQRKLLNGNWDDDIDAFNNRGEGE